MKISTIFLMVIAMDITLLLFGGVSVHDTPLLSTILEPTGWASNELWLAISALAGLALIGGSYVGGLIMGKNDLAVFAIFVSGSVITWLAPIATFWQIMYSQGLFPNETIEMAGRNITMNGLIASIFIAPIIILAFWATLNWWRTAFAEG